MTRLTLEWHLRGLIHGATSAEQVRLDIGPGSHRKSREWHVRQRYYGDPTDEARKRVYDAAAAANGYTTGFTQASGEFCDALDVPARQALESGDPVAYLDAVAHDPTRRHQERHDAAQLLGYHIWPEPPRSTNSVTDAERDDVSVDEWHEAGMRRPHVGPTYLPMRCVSDDCMEGECLADWDVLAETGRAECMVCGTEQPIPEYP